MTDLDIQTAQLIIQLARDDIYQLDDSFSDNNRDGELSDLEFALAEQEREFMQYWTEYGHTQMNRNAGSSSHTRAGGSGNTAVASSSRGVPIALNDYHVQKPPPGPIHLQDVKTVNLIDVDDVDDGEDLYVSPFEQILAASSGSSNDRNHDSIDDNRRPRHSLVGVDREETNLQSNADEPNPFFASLLSSLTASNDQPTTSNSITTHRTPVFGSALPEDEGIRPSSPSLEQLLSNIFVLSNSQAVPSSTTAHRVQSFTGSQGPQASSSNSVPQRTAVVHVASPVDEGHSVEIIPGYPATPPRVATIPQLRATVQASPSRIASNIVQSSSGSQAPLAGPSNSVPPRANTVRAVSSNDPDIFEMIAGYSTTPPNIFRPRAVCMVSNFNEELGEGSVSGESIEDPPEPMVECHFCKDICPISTTINTSCNHRLCRGCISRLVGICIKDETAYPPKCCSNKLQISELRLLDHTLRRQFEAKAREYETPVPVRVYCYRCGEFLDSNSSTITSGSSSSMSAASVHTSRYCGSCFVRTCVSCKHPSHPTRGCQDTPDERALKSLAKQKGWQTCPNCKVVVELKEGCYHVMCRCTAQFCYLCATTWKKCDCPAFDEERLLAAPA